MNLGHATDAGEIVPLDDTPAPAEPATDDHQQVLADTATA